MMNCDVYMVGVGGQGILTIGQVLTRAAQGQGIPASFFPIRGMAQRGGFVKAQLRLGREDAGPNIPDGRADLVISMEVSESLKAVRYVRRGGEFLLYGYRWEPTAVMLKKAPYPELDAVRAEVLAAGARLLYVDPAGLPELQGRRAPDNLYLLGAALGHTALGAMFDRERVAEVLRSRWPKAVEINTLAFEAGLKANVTPEAAVEAGA